MIFYDFLDGYNLSLVGTNDMPECLAHKPGIGNEPAILKRAQRAMNLGGTCLLQDLTGIVGTDPRTRHDDDASLCLLHQRAKQRDALHRRAALTRSEQPMATQGYDLLERFLRTAALIESAVEGIPSAASIKARQCSTSMSPSAVSAPITTPSAPS